MSYVVLLLLLLLLLQVSRWAAAKGGHASISGGAARPATPRETMALLTAGYSTTHIGDWRERGLQRPAYILRDRGPLQHRSLVGCLECRPAGRLSRAPRKCWRWWRRHRPARARRLSRAGLPDAP
ncbi:uncharacterized protein K452DRAFT_91942 [Aplosporella prunicola CBS 121167]|uniref:Uncharacterized protein n=1 Tax=Aplosporella prunicola CBS 121167 TaxID=1176127 RepID=A0A6A6B5T0_9PEZI|nr:uncharacterized protein K452DRAFT_91942 [Aplosporella prunicola CBS 121167]KAF2138327.1 hypothetical protein K452DRAFT_91942 [Aplosporella prunicola CBS 121167]